MPGGVRCGKAELAGESGARVGGGEGTIGGPACRASEERERGCREPAGRTCGEDPGGRRGPWRKSGARDSFPAGKSRTKTLF